ncbi:hypothetical protein CAPTEDRAFT_99345 [Capitella teleta]|uniref:BTB domain-containing protein n=1 Tax=Capitella teleta TaxID=283909 RepID=R7TP15_CAPTE|nr:hypothetical protein CAPTEDRAFT_99345 [Capitella teleta]|eukprot:ELT95379.1 hypothetical protein CAPTEDRAFT_99345 [Capitella teleta]
MATLHKLQEKEVMTDVTLTLPDQSAIPCHKVVLMAASPFFETMFQSGLKEGAEQNIKLDFADSDTIKTLVKFMYTGDIKLTAENAKEIVAGSEFLCCKHLNAHCEEYLADTVDCLNCIDYYRLGKVFNLKLLIKTAFDFILFKFKEFKGIANFDKLTEDELVEVVSCDQLNVENEDVFHFNCEWKSEQEMLCGVHRPHIVQFANKVYAFGGWKTRVTQEFDPALNEWRMRSQMPGRCCYGAAVAFGDKIYVVGGEEKVCYSYDPENDEWKVLSKPTHAYHYSFPFATVWQGKILLGNKEHVEEYDPVEDRWSNRDELLPDGDINEMILHASCTL